MRLRFIKVAKHSRFEFLPRYYDADKEESEARKAVVESDARLEKTNPQEYRARISEAFKSRSREQDKQSIIIRAMLAIVITGLLLMMYWFMLQM